MPDSGPEADLMTSAAPGHLAPILGQSVMKAMVTIGNGGDLPRDFSSTSD